LVRAPLRRHLANLLAHEKPGIPVLTFGEVIPAAGVDAVGMVQVQLQAPEAVASPASGMRAAPIRKPALSQA
jgi:hypothetical protein